MATIARHSRGLDHIVHSAAMVYPTGMLDADLVKFTAAMQTNGLSLLYLPASDFTFYGLSLFALFYGLDWVATVPPTVALCRERFGAAGPIVFGWVFASHQIGAAFAAWGAGFLRDVDGSYDNAWYVGAGLCMAGAIMSLAIRRQRILEGATEKVSA